MKKVKCKVCQKEFEGHTDGQVEHQLRVHILAKHASGLNYLGRKRNKL